MSSDVPMPSAEETFKDICRMLVKRGYHPAAGAIFRQLGYGAKAIKKGNLNGRQVGWLREDLKVSPTRGGSPYATKLGPCQLFCCKPGGLFIGPHNLRCRLGWHYPDSELTKGHIAATREYREHYRTCIRCGYRWVRNDTFR